MLHKLPFLLAAIQAGFLGERLLALPQRDFAARKAALYPLATWRLRLLMG
jgi:hypothetical protein